LAGIGWFGLLGSTLSAIFLWNSLSSDGFDDIEYTTVEKLSTVFGSVVLAVIGSLLLAGFGHGLRLLALHVSAASSR
jgi:hypothetical protein